MGKVTPRFSRSCLRNAEHVTAVQRRWNGLRLNRRWLGVALVLDGVEQFVTQAEVLEGRMGSPRAEELRVTRAHVLHPRREAHHVCAWGVRAEARGCLQPRHDDGN